MNKAAILFAFAAGVVCVAMAKGDGDKVLMTINQKPVTLAEFEYLYHKNQNQQMAEQPIGEYLDLFITYKQKVADAEAEGIDKTDAFLKEYEGYRRDLAAPYLESKEVEDSLIDVAYNHMKEEVSVSHIMLANRGEGLDRSAQRMLLDSIRTAVLNGADFAELARKYSIDPSVSHNGGYLGVVAPMRLPYEFEDAAYNTPVGGVSDVFETMAGYHIVKVEGRRPARGQVLVEHILKLTQGLTDAEAAQKKAEIDSLYNVVKDGADFADVAIRESEDPGSARQGGKLPWFGPGQMVPEFEVASFDLAVDSISQPIKTAYGYHIIHKLDARGIDSKEKLTPTIKAAINSDVRSTMPRKRKIEQLRKQYNAKIKKDVYNAVKSEIIANGGLDSALIAQYVVDDRVIGTIGKQEVLLSEVVDDMFGPLRGSVGDQLDRFSEFVNGKIDGLVVEAERNNLAETNADYRNLLNEYHDGVLLFEVADRKVWSRAKNDKEGLEKYFQANRDKYAWDKPRFKSVVIFTPSDSIMQAAKKYLDENPQSAENVALALRKEFGKDVKVQRVIAAQGENPITDYLGFGAAKPEGEGRWAYYFPYLNRVLDAPEEASDVRGAVTGDYQNYLEQLWIKELKLKYPAKVNKKILKLAK